MHVAGDTLRGVPPKQWSDGAVGYFTSAVQFAPPTITPQIPVADSGGTFMRIKSMPGSTAALSPANDRTFESPWVAALP